MSPEKMINAARNRKSGKECAPPAKGGCDLDGWISPAVPFSRRLKKNPNRLKVSTCHEFTVLKP